MKRLILISLKWAFIAFLMGFMVIIGGQSAKYIWPNDPIVINHFYPDYDSESDCDSDPDCAG